MDTLLQDLGFGLRSLRKSPGFASLTVLTLALGIGATTAIFSVVNGVVLEPLAYPSPEGLMLVTSQFPNQGFDQFWISPPEFAEFRERNHSFSGVGAYTTDAVNLGGTDQPSRIASAIVSSDVFDVLGVKPLRGRTIAPEDNRPGAAPVVVLSSELWQRAFASDETIIGRAIEVDGVRTPVVGIMPPGFDIHEQHVELWTPLTVNLADPNRRGNHFLYLVGRLKPGATLAQARADMDTLLLQWPAINPGTHTPDPKNHRLRIDTLQDDIIGSVRTALWVLQGAVGFVLLIACANLANLLLARAESRQREFAIRSALGAGRMRLLRQFLTEGMLLAFAGGLAGSVIATVGLRALLATYPNSIPRSMSGALDPTVLIFTVMIAMSTGVLFGLAPMLHLRPAAMTVSLKEGGQRTTHGSARALTRQILVMAEVALAVVLVIGAGLLLRSFWNLMQVDAGFDRSRLMTFGLVLPTATYQDPQSRVDFFSRLETRIAALPGVQGAAAMSGLPPFRQVDANDTDFEGLARTSEAPIQNVDYYQFVTADYLTTLGIPVVEGRGFARTDAGGSPVAMVNQTLAQRFWPGQNPLGHRLKPGGDDKVSWLRVVGVVKDVKQGGVDAKTGTELYMLFDQAPDALAYSPSTMNVVVRSTLPVPALAPTLRAVVRDMDRSLPIVNMRSMDEVFVESVARPRFLAQLLGMFALLALVLAAIGTYGVLSYSVTERRQEIGIRMALGASRGRVLGMVIGQGMKLASAGLVVGLAGAWGLTRLLASLLFGVRPTDPATLASVAGFITLVALTACLLPAHRATRVDPMVVLRQD